MTVGWDLLNKVTYFISIYTRSNDCCSYILQPLAEGREPSVWSPCLCMFWDILLHITAAQSESTFTACQLAWTYLATLLWPLSYIMHLCPQNFSCCQDVFFVVVLFVLTVNSLMRKYFVLQLYGSLSDAGISQSVMIIPYWKQQKSHILPISLFGWMAT